MKFAASWLDRLSEADTAVATVRDPGTMGWRYEDGKRIGFIYGNMLFREDGSEIPLSASTDNDFRYWYTPVGKREAWLKAAKLLTDRKRPELDILVSVGFAAPLMTFAGTLYGAILSIWGEPGTAKSTAQQVAAAIWGHPKQTRESLNSTPKSVQKRLGLCRNLAAYWDDIQDKRHQDALFQTLFVATQGTEGGRLNQGNAGMIKRLEWQTLLVACSNSSFVEYCAHKNLLHKEQATTASIRRVFEIEVRKKEGEPGMINATDAGRVFAALEQNYGVIGTEYARMLAKEHTEIDLMVADTIKAFCAKVEGVSDEAYWWGSCGVLLAGAKLARRLGAEMDVDAMEVHLENAFRYNRKIRDTEGTEGGPYKNTEMVLINFLNFYIRSHHLLVTDRPPTHRFLKPEILRSPLPGRPVVVQIVRDARLIRFSKRKMSEYMYKKEIKTRQVFHGLEKFFLARMTPNMQTLGSGTTFSTGLQETCVDLVIPAGRPHVLLDMFEEQIKPQEGVIFRAV